MKTEKFELEISNYDNAAMAEDPTGETVRILRELADRIEENGVPHVDGSYLRDYNGNRVGYVSVDCVVLAGHRRGIGRPLCW